MAAGNELASASIAEAARRAAGNSEKAQKKSQLQSTARCFSGERLES